MYKEMEFLFDNSNKLHLDNKENKDDIYNKIYNKDETGERTVVYKHSSVVGTDKIKNHIKTKVYKNETDENDYIRLLSDFNGTTSDTVALKLRPADFAYLKKLGVYPINRLMILRRFPEGVYVPNNLASWKNPVEPISTVVGWVDEGNEEMFSVNFNERWGTSKQMLHELFGQILENELPAVGKMKPVPSAGWSQGLLFGFLQKAGLVSDEYSFTNIPAGDPNVLQEAAMREGGMGGGASWDYTLESDIKVTFETEYEQKFIGDIDPGSALLDIINNVIRMGTSDVKYILKNSKFMSSLIQAANSKGTDQLNAWVHVISEFVGAIAEGLKELAGEGVEIAKQTVTGDANKALNALTTLGNTFLTATVGKYKIPLNASIGVMTGVNTAPWHLTIGNPYSPILTAANIVVDTVDVKMNNSLGFNDMPTGFKLNIGLKLGRNLGGQEIFRMFNNTYFRYYKNVSNKATTFGEMSANDNSPITQLKGNNLSRDEILIDKLNPSIPNRDGIIPSRGTQIGIPTNNPTLEEILQRNGRIV